jgi:hypothetical protein
LTAAQADGEVINGEDGGNDGEIVITDLGDVEVDLSGLNAGTMTATLSGNVTLDENTDLGDVDVNIDGNTLTLSGAQADGTTITGSGDVTVTNVEAGHDLSNIETTGTLNINVESGVTELSLSAASVSGATSVIDGDDLETVTLINLEDVVDDDGEMNADFSAVTITNDIADDPVLNIELDSTGDQIFDETANLTTADSWDVNVQISGDGAVSVEEGATVVDTTATQSITWDIGADATLVADESFTDAASEIDYTNDVSGAGTLQVQDFSNDTVELNSTVDEGPRFTEISFNEDIGDYAGTENIQNFETGTFTWDSVDLLSGVHRLDFTDIFDTADFNDVSSVFTSADQSGTADILSFSVAVSADNNAIDVAGSFQTAGNYTDGSTTVDFGSGAERIFITSDDTNADIWYWQDGPGGTAGEVDAGELTQLGNLEDIGLTGLADLEDANFIFAA